MAGTEVEELKTINLIAEQPLMFEASAIDDSVRVAVISKQTSLFIVLLKIQNISLFFGIIVRNLFYLKNSNAIINLFTIGTFALTNQLHYERH